MDARPIVALFGFALVGIGAPAPQALPPSLAAARAALGGETRLASVDTVAARGRLTQRYRGRASQSVVDFWWATPDRFALVTYRGRVGGSLDGFATKEHVGFTQGALIDIFDNGPFTIVQILPPTRMPDEVAADEARTLRSHRFVRRFLPPFAASPRRSPLAFTDAGTVDTESGPAPVLDVEAPSGATWRLVFNPTTGLPASMTWRDAPIVEAASAPMAGARGASPNAAAVPTANPTAGPVAWRLEVSDYRESDGLTWPHRFRTFVAGELYEDLRFGEYRVNEAIDPDVFTPKGR